jgi:hypothetical protein
MTSTARRARHRAAIACAATLVSLISSPARAGGPLCTQVVVAPDFARSRTAYCARLVHDATSTTLTLARSTDGGRTWRRATAAGLAVRPDDYEAHLLVSTEYASDRAIFVGLSTSGTFRSTDGGESFVLVDANGNGAVAASRTVGTDPLPRVRRGVLVVAGPGVAGSFLVDPPMPRLPITGTGLDVAFAPAPDDPGTVLAFGSNLAGGDGYQVTAYGCTQAFSCPTALGSLPAGKYIERVWLSPRFTSDGVLIVRTVDRTHRTTYYRSTDGGRTFAVLTSVQRLVDAIYRTGGVPMSDIAGAVVHGRARLWLRLGDAFGRTSGPPAEQVLVSDDLGSTWRLLSFGRQPWQPGPRGTILPSAPGGATEPVGFLTATPDRLFMAGFRGVYCSVDGGVHWAAACAR